MKKIIFFLYSATVILTAHAHNKIVGLVQVRNEENCIAQCLTCLSPFVNAIVVLDDGSEDKTLDIVTKLSSILPIEKIIKNKTSMWEQGFESTNKQALLEAGRSIGGTHFVIIDADEVITANCLYHDMLKKQILSLRPGEVLVLTWIQFWRSPYRYRRDDSIWSNQYIERIFCDNPNSCYQEYFLHGSQLPSPTKGKRYYLPLYEYGIMHFQFVNWDNLLLKQAWYRCLEHIRHPEKSISAINNRYAPSKSEVNVQTWQAPEGWFSGYQHFDHTIYNAPNIWRKKSVVEWFEQYGKQYFKDLDIWDVDWK